MLSVKQGGIKYHFMSLWYDLAWDWTPVSRIIGEHCKIANYTNSYFYSIRRDKVIACYTQKFFQNFIILSKECVLYMKYVLYKDNCGMR